MTPEQLDQLTPDQREAAVDWLRNHRPHAYRTLDRMGDARFRVSEAEKDALRVAVAAIPTEEVTG